MRIELESGIDATRLMCWLDRVDAGSAHVSVCPLPSRKLGQVELPRTSVVFEGPQSQVETLYESFNLHFAGAGG